MAFFLDEVSDRIRLRGRISGYRSGAEAVRQRDCRASRDARDRVLPDERRIADSHEFAVCTGKRLDGETVWRRSAVKAISRAQARGRCRLRAIRASAFRRCLTVVGLTLA
jgi:hypothetical protein